MCTNIMKNQRPKVPLGVRCENVRKVSNSEQGSISLLNPFSFSSGLHTCQSKVNEMDAWLSDNLEIVFPVFSEDSPVIQL